MKKQKDDILEYAEEFAYGYDAFKNKWGVIKLFDYQKKILTDLEKNQFTVIKQSRQMGIAFTMAVYITYFIIKNKDKRILVVSNNTKSAIDFLDKVRLIVSYVGIPTKGWLSQKHISFENGCQINVIGNSPNAGKSHTLDLLYINNFEYVPSAEMIWAASAATLCPGGKVIISSSPQYKKDLFHKLWTGATKKTNGFKPISIIWSQNPFCDELWYKNECMRLGYNPDSIATEIDAKFIDKKEKGKKSAINIRLKQDKKDKILKRMIEKNISSITEYVMELINKDLES